MGSGFPELVGALKQMKEIIESIAMLKDCLPIGYSVQICIAQSEAWVQVVTPDGRRHQIPGAQANCFASCLTLALAYSKIHQSNPRVSWAS